MDTTEQVADELSQLYAQDNAFGAFPQQDCSKLLKGNGKTFVVFVPDLSLYLHSIWGCAESAKFAREWNAEKIALVERVSAKSFWEMHPNYRELEAQITPSNTPKLYVRLTLSEEMRRKIVQLLFLLKEQAKHSQS